MNTSLRKHNLVLRSYFLKMFARMGTGTPTGIATPRLNREVTRTKSRLLGQNANRTEISFSSSLSHTGEQASKKTEALIPTF